jgi:hypothetical protein
MFNGIFDVTPICGKAFISLTVYGILKRFFADLKIIFKKLLEKSL